MNISASIGKPIAESIIRSFIISKSVFELFEALSTYSFAPAYGLVALVVLLCGLIIWKLDKKISFLDDGENVKSALQN